MRKRIARSPPGTPPCSDTTYSFSGRREGKHWFVGFKANMKRSVRHCCARHGISCFLQDRGALIFAPMLRREMSLPGARGRSTPLFSGAWSEEINTLFGIMGGANRRLAHAQFVSTFADYGHERSGSDGNARFTVVAARVANIVRESRPLPPEESARESAAEVSAGWAINWTCVANTPPPGSRQAVLHDSKAKELWGVGRARRWGCRVPEHCEQWQVASESKRHGCWPLPPTTTMVTDSRSKKIPRNKHHIAAARPNAA